MCYPKYVSGDFFIVGDMLYINTLKNYGDPDNNLYIEVPLSIFYKDTMEEYINKLHEEKLKKEEEEKKRVYEQNRQAAIAEIEKLKKAYNIN